MDIQIKNSEVDYKNRIEKYSERIDKLRKRINVYSIIRGLFFLGLVGLISYLYIKNIYDYIFLITFTGVVAFIVLVSLHNKIKDEKKHYDILKNINLTSLKRLNGEWKSFEDNGEEFIDAEHRYSKDLDIFGSGSLFQMVNTSNTYNGRKILADILNYENINLEKLKEKQTAIEELASRIDWRQEFQAEGMKKIEKTEKKAESKSLDELYLWVKNKNTFFRKPIIGVLSKIMPIATVGMLILAIAKLVPYYPFVFLLGGQILLLILVSKRTIGEFGVVDKYRNIIEIYEKMVKLIEEEDFNSKYLSEMKEGFGAKKKRSAYRQIKALSSITSMIAMRYSELYLVFNLLLLWDYQCGIALEAWKEQTGENLEKWFKIIGEFEALSSLSLINCDNPNWSIPIIREEEKIYSAQNIGHPLLNRDRVNNNFSINTRGGVMLITGSNMSGKSTLLRTAGINLVLAYSGTAVCAEKLICPYLEVYTSMRIEDNLDKNISSFYAELLRIKTILEAARKGKRVFFLLDEIFRGTNSRDRHTGAMILIKNLIKEGAAGFVSTHDLELGDLEEDDNYNITNYHFKEYYKEGQIYFDYKLYRGVSSTRNAVYLMKLAGIDFDNS